MSSVQNETIFGTIGTWWRNWRQQRAAIAELNGLGEPELAHIAHDVGLNAPELRALAGRWPASTGLLSQRLEALRLDETAIGKSEPAVLRDLERVCGQCAAEGQCAHDLASDPDDRVWRDYCPNVATLDALGSEEKDRRLMRRRRWHKSVATLPPCC
jgi:hypothetical protein